MAPVTVLIRREAIARIAGDLGPETRVIPGWQDLPSALQTEGPVIDAMITAGDRVDAALMAQLPRLQLICCFGAGYDNIDLAAARARGIAVTAAQGLNAADVADFGVALLLALFCQLPAGDALVRSGHWHAGASTGLRRSVATHAVGIVGLGGIGRELAPRIAAFGCPVRWWGPRPQPGVIWPRSESLMALAAASDALVVCARAEAANSRMIGADVLAAMPPGGYLVNVARGTLVDEAAVKAALVSGSLAGAALDVFESEPASADFWADIPNVLLSPHRAGTAASAVERQAEHVRDNLARFRAGIPLLGLVG